MPRDVCLLSTDELLDLADRLQPGALLDQVEAELERRDYDASDPWSPQNHRD